MSTAYMKTKGINPPSMTNLVSVSPSELATWNDCRRKWSYRYGDRIEPVDQSKPAPLASGIVVHHVIETICRDFPGEIPDPTDIKVRALDRLEFEFRDNYEPEKQVFKFLPGVIRALGKVPDWVWKADWFVERDISGLFPDFDRPYVELHGRPDMFRLVDGLSTGYEVDKVEIIDVKTTQTEPLEFLLWSPQLRYYAAVLQQMYPNRLITYRYLCLPTQGNSPAPQSPAWPFTPAQHKEAIAEIVDLATSFCQVDIEPRYSRACSFCEFAPICKGIITGADPASIVEELYQPRTPHD